MTSLNKLEVVSISLMTASSAEVNVVFNGDAPTWSLRSWQSVKQFLNCITLSPLLILPHLISGYMKYSWNMTAGPLTAEHWRQ
ncbi:hypothetical protein IFU20_15255 [Pseudomonas viridiflava]|uniref:hypothetical protein n=1 Tax=Pseudomonas viridiflava TaxID=33069 RepID=UPI00177CF957|nr:hypothetical protein [Pseudomonas viridiflava]MBD8187540.1 hypothetical protein [Pseudomonas viridiflava]